MIWPVGQGLGKHRIEGLVIRKTWEEYVDGFSEMGRVCRYFYPK